MLLSGAPQSAASIETGLHNTANTDGEGEAVDNGKALALMLCTEEEARNDPIQKWCK